MLRQMLLRQPTGSGSEDFLCGFTGLQSCVSQPCLALGIGKGIKNGAEGLLLPDGVPPAGKVWPAGLHPVHGQLIQPQDKWRQLRIRWSVAAIKKVTIPGERLVHICKHAIQSQEGLRQNQRRNAFLNNGFSLCAALGIGNVQIIGGKLLRRFQQDLLSPKQPVSDGVERRKIGIICPFQPGRYLRRSSRRVWPEGRTVKSLVCINHDYRGSISNLPS